VTETEQTEPPPAAADVAAVELIKAIHRAVPRTQPSLTPAQSAALQDRLRRLFTSDEPVRLIESIVAHTVAIRAHRTAADTTLQDRRAYTLATSASKKMATTWAALDELGRLRALRKLEAFDGPGTLSQAFELLPLVDELLANLAPALEAAARAVIPRRGSPSIAEEIMFLVEEVGRVWVRFGPRGRKGPPAVTNSLKAGGFADFVITALAGPEFGFTQAQLKTAVRQHVSALRRAANTAAGKRAG
jgi:hypothetical protein